MSYVEHEVARGAPCNRALRDEPGSLLISRDSYTDQEVSLSCPITIMYLTSLLLSGD